MLVSPLVSFHSSGAMKSSIVADLAAAEPALVNAAAALDSINKKDLGELKNLKSPPAGIVRSPLLPCVGSPSPSHPLPVVYSPLRRPP